MHSFKTPIKSLFKEALPQNRFAAYRRFFQKKLNEPSCSIADVLDEAIISGYKVRPEEDTEKRGEEGKGEDGYEISITSKVLRIAHREQLKNENVNWSKWDDLTQYTEQSIWVE